MPRNQTIECYPCDGLGYTLDFATAIENDLDKVPEIKCKECKGIGIVNTRFPIKRKRDMLKKYGK